MRRPGARPAAAALALTLLTGCTGEFSPGGAAELTRAELAEGPGGKVTAAAPPGYCIDRRSLRHGPRGGFALIARCDTLGVRSLFPNRRLALITVTTAPMQPGAAAPTLGDLTQSVAPAQVIESRRIDKLPLVRLGDDPGSVEGLAPQHWRGAFALNGQLVALAIYVPETAPGPDGAAAELLADVANRIRQASGAAAAPPTDPAPARKPAAAAGPGKSGKLARAPARTDRPPAKFISAFEAIAGLFP
ncbi:MAG: hypothetical protein AB7S99_01290 [Pseudodonghicola sp.]